MIRPKLWIIASLIGVVGLGGTAAIAQRPGGGPGDGMGYGGGPGLLSPYHAEVVEQLDLSADQQADMEALRSQVLTQVEAVLTPDQQTQLRTAFESGEVFGVLRDLDLDADQRDQLRSIMGAAHDQASTILTDAQQDEVRTMMRDRMGNHQGQRRDRHRDGSCSEGEGRPRNQSSQSNQSSQIDQ